MQDDGANAPTDFCPEGFDYRLLRSFLRNFTEEQGPLPAVMAHIWACSVCRPKWEFLERTDPTVRGQFEARVRSLAEQVVVQEIIFPRKAFGMPVGSDVIAQIQASLASPTPLRMAATSISQVPGMDRVLDVTAPLEPRLVVGILDRVRSIPDEKERQLKGGLITALFGSRLESRKVSEQTVREVLSKLSSSHRSEVLDDDTNVEVAATIPETTSAIDPPLVTLVGEQAFFNAPQFQRLRSMATC